MKQYIYQVKHAFVKDTKGVDGGRRIEKFRFLPYKSDLEDDNEIFYAIHFKLKEDSKIIKAIINGVSKVYTRMSEQERAEEELVKDLNFEEVVDCDSGKKTYVYVPTQEQMDSFRTAQLCFSLNGFAKCVLFINAANNVQYYAKEVLDEECSEMIKSLLSSSVIYKKISNL